MKKFLLNLILFILPLGILFILPLLIFFLSREYLPLSAIVARQQASSEEILYSSGIDATDRQYKMETLAVKDPEVTVFGTSRTLTWKPSFFKDPSVFYNSGYTAASYFRTADLLTFINSVPRDGKLRVVLFDASSFLVEAAVGSSTDISLYDVIHTYMTSTWRNTYSDYVKGKFSLWNLISTESTDGDIGINARVHHAGYTKDGNLNRNITQSKAELNDEVNKAIQSELSFIVPGHGGFADYSATIPEENIQTIEQFLALSKEKNVYVIGYLSPFATELREKMLSLNDSYSESYKKTPIVLDESFKKYGFNFYDVRDLSLIGSDDTELYDSHHPTEKSTIKLLLYLATKEKKLQAYIDEAQLKKQIEAEKF